VNQKLGRNWQADGSSCEQKNIGETSQEGTKVKAFRREKKRLPSLKSGEVAKLREEGASTEQKGIKASL